MKKIVLFVMLAAIVLCGCANINVSIIGGADGPTNINITKNKGNKNEEEYEKDDIKMVRIDGALYYETGEENDAARCGVADGSFKKAAGKYEVPRNDGESNFGGANSYQIGESENTMEIPIDDDWEIFRKIETNADVLNYKYCYTLEGRLPNAESDSEFLVLSNEKDTTFSDAAYILFGADMSKRKDIYVLVIDDD